MNETQYKKFLYEIITIEKSQYKFNMLFFSFQFVIFIMLSDVLNDKGGYFFFFLFLYLILYIIYKVKFSKYRMFIKTMKQDIAQNIYYGFPQGTYPPSTREMSYNKNRDTKYQYFNQDKKY